MVEEVRALRISNEGGTSLVFQWLRLCTPNSGGPGSIPARGRKSHMLQLSIYMPQLSPGTHKYIYIYIYSFPGGSDGKESACNAGDLGSVPGLGRSPEGEHGNPL